MLLSDLLAFPNNLGLDIFLHSGVKPKPPNFFIAFFLLLSQSKNIPLHVIKLKMEIIIIIWVLDESNPIAFLIIPVNCRGNFQACIY